MLPILWAITSMKKPTLYVFEFFKKTFNLVFKLFQNQRIVNSKSLKNQDQRIVGLSNLKRLKSLQFVKNNNFMVGYLNFSKKLKTCNYIS